MAEFNVTPRKKVKLDPLSEEVDACIFCKGPFSAENSKVNTKSEKLDALFNACALREDEVGKSILENKSAVLNGTKLLSYHRDCRSTYCSEYHIKRDNNKNGKQNNSVTPKESAADTKDNENGVTTRAQMSNPSFDWQNNCFICGNRCFPSHRFSSGKGNWSLVASAVNDKSDNIYIQVLEAAKKLNDTEMLQRLLGSGPDLVAADARYHRKKSCLVKYLKKANRSVERGQDNNAPKEIMRLLKEEYYIPLMVEKQVFRLSTIRDRCNEIAAQNWVENPPNYTSHQVKEKLHREWTELSFLPQPGLSDIVCSDEISVGDALAKVHDLTTMLEDEYEEINLGQTDAVEVNDDESIVHMAVGILRKRMKETKKIDEEYFSSKEIAVDTLKDFVDPLLYKTLGWLSSESLYQNAENPDTKAVSSKCLNIACDIIAMSTSAMTPKHLGLSVYLHHEFGARKLIDDMYKLGYGISYTELRQFLTSAAANIAASQTFGQAGALVPPEIVPKWEGGKPIIAVADNWDHNEATVDGKQTTHAMTSIIVTPEVKKVDFPRIPRLPGRTLDCASVEG